MSDTIAITSYATKNYTKAMHRLLERVVACVRYTRIPFEKFSIILSGDSSKEFKEAGRLFEAACKVTGMRYTALTLQGLVDNANNQHRKDSNLTIAQMQNAAWHEARMQGVDKLWSVESDTLPQPNALRCLLDTLAFDNGWYDVAMATYPNNEFLGGRGTPQNWILPSVRADERKLTADVKKRIARKERRVQELNKKHTPPTKEDEEEWRALDKAIEQCPPLGNIFELSARNGWRKRGWMSSAYPGIGQGAILPVDWVGTGCTLMSRRALDLADFTGYDGGPTQDLWICWRAWAPAGLRLAVVPHSLASHVKPLPETPGQPDSQKVTKILFARHEMGGECHGHLRSDERPWDGM